MARWDSMLVMTEDEARALWRLRNRWLGTYQISLPRGQWAAARYGQRQLLTAGTAEELGRLVEADYDSLTARRSA
jgi:hypothetical protein